MKTAKNNWGFDARSNIASTQYHRDLLALLGGSSFEGVAFTRSQMKALGKVYGAISEEELEEHRKQVLENIQNKPKPTKENTPYNLDRAVEQWEKRMEGAEEAAKGSADLRRAGVQRDVFRQVRRDGLRVMGFLAPYLQEDEDPVKLVAQLLVDAGYDVDPCVVTEFFYSEEE